jgi:hypothetical protein
MTDGLNRPNGHWPCPRVPELQEEGSRCLINNAKEIDTTPAYAGMETAAAL